MTSLLLTHTYIDINTQSDPPSILFDEFFQRLNYFLRYKLFFSLPPLQRYYKSKRMNFVAVPLQITMLILFNNNKKKTTSVTQHVTQYVARNYVLF